MKPTQIARITALTALLALSALLLAACSDLFGKYDNPLDPDAPGYVATVAAPVMSPPPGNFDAPTSVTITTATPGAVIRYTTDGSVPTATTGTVYSAAIPIPNSLNLKAAGFANGGATVSEVTDGNYHLRSWSLVGGDLTGTAAMYISLAMHGEQAFVALYENASPHDGRAFSLNGTAWNELSSAAGFAADSTAIVSTAIAVSSTGTPYVAYAAANILITKFFNGTSWVNLIGTPSGIASSELSLVLSGTTPWVAYGDGASYPSVAYHNGTNWTNVILTAPAGKTAISLVLDSTTPYVATSDLSFTMVTGRAGFPGGTWTPLNPDASGMQSNSTSLVSVGGVLHLAFEESGGFIKVKKYLGSTWVSVGPTLVASGGDSVRLAADASNNLYLAYRDIASSKVVVKKFDGTNWVNLGPANFSPPIGTFLAFRVSDSGNVYVAFDNTANSSRAQVMRFY